MDGQDSALHILYPHMMHILTHTIPQLDNRQPFPQTDNSELKREVARVNKAEGLVNTLNNHEFDDEQSKWQINKEIEGCVCCKSRCNAHCLYKENIGEPCCFSKGIYSKGNIQK